MLPAIQTWPSLDDAAGARTFIGLRWVWLALELGAGLIAWSAYHADPLVLLVVLALGWLSNAALAFLRPGATLHHVAGAAMVFDAVRLTALLALAGAASTPLSATYLVQVVLSALLLPPGWISAVVLTAIVGYGTLFLAPPPTHHAHDMFAHDVGMWVTVAFVAPFVATSITLLRVALIRASLQVQEATAQRERDARLSAVGTLAAGAAHELATPLATIAIAAGELATKVEGNCELAEDVALVREQVTRCRAILTQLAADVGAGMGELNSLTTVGDLLDEALGALDVADRTAALERIDLLGDDALFDTPISLPSRLVAHALAGLVKNGLQASTAPDPVALEARREADQLHLEVRDHGTGMPADVLDRAREPFFTTKAPGQGTGLGLFVASSVADRLGGHLHLDSRPGVGTTVTLCLPWPEIQP